MAFAFTGTKLEAARGGNPNGRSLTGVRVRMATGPKAGPAITFGTNVLAEMGVNYKFTADVTVGSGIHAGKLAIFIKPEGDTSGAFKSRYTASKATTGSQLISSAALPIPATGMASYKLELADNCIVVKMPPAAAPVELVPSDAVDPFTAA